MGRCVAKRSRRDTTSRQTEIPSGHQPSWPSAWTRHHRLTHLILAPRLARSVGPLVRDATSGPTSAAGHRLGQRSSRWSIEPEPLVDHRRCIPCHGRIHIIHRHVPIRHHGALRRDRIAPGRRSDQESRKHSHADRRTHHRSRPFRAAQQQQERIATDRQSNNSRQMCAVEAIILRHTSIGLKCAVVHTSSHPRIQTTIPGSTRFTFPDSTIGRSQTGMRVIRCDVACG